MSEITAYLNDIKDYGLLSEEEEIKYATANTPEAKNELVVHNLRLAFSIAKSFQGRGVPLEDLIQEANLGLMKAVERFDASKGYRFSTYASWWIRQTLSKCIQKQSRTIRIPAHIIEAYNKIERTITELCGELGRFPSMSEVGEKVGRTAAEVEEIRGYFVEPISIDSTFGEDEDNSIASVIADENIESPIEYCLSNSDDSIVELVLSTLGEREAYVIRERIQNGKSLEEVSKALEITAERVRQIELKALRKLRHPYRAEVLRGILL